MTNITLQDLTYRGETHTGSEFDNLIIAAAEGNGKFYRILFDNEGEFVLNHPKIKDLSNFFEYHFNYARLDGKECLINIQ